MSDTSSSESTGSPETLPIRERIIEALKTIFDPEIPVNIWELGLIYRVEVDEAGKVEIDMTLTSPACPVAESLPVAAENKVREVEGVSDVKMAVVWEPIWNPELMSEAAQLELGLG
jgi:FeS assembly SUF system protein